MLTSVDMKLGADDGRPYVPVKINGSDQTMLVDTGGVFTEIKSGVADALHMDQRNSPVEMIGTNGDVSTRSARGSLVMGTLSADAIDFMVMTDTHGLDSSAAGLFAPNLLKSYDADFDFGAGKFNLISQNHCDGKVVYWPATAVAVIPMYLDKTGHIFLTVTLDGKDMQAMLDTGASTTVLDLAYATSYFGVKPGAADTPYVATMGKNSGSYAYAHRFKTLSLEGITVSNPNIELIPDLMDRTASDAASNLEGETRIHNRDEQAALSPITLGMDVLHRFHLYIAYKERKIYISPASAPTGPASAGLSATANAGTKP